MSLCGNYFLLNENFATYGAVLTFGLTGIYTISCNSLVNNLGVSKLFNRNCFSADLCATYGALNYAFVRACSLTGCSYFIFFNCFSRSVSKSINFFLCNKNFVTYRTMLTFGKTGCFTLGSNSCVNNLGMSCERKGHSRNNVSTSTSYSLRTCNATSRINYCFGWIYVTGWVNFLGIVIAARTSECFFTLCFTSGLNSNFLRVRVRVRICYGKLFCRRVERKGIFTRSLNNESTVVFFWAVALLK